MIQCQGHDEQAPASETRLRLVQAEDSIVRDAIDHLRDEGMFAMAEAVEIVLTKYEIQAVRDVEQERAHVQR